MNIIKEAVKSNKLYDLTTHEVIDGNYNQAGFDWSQNILDLKGEQDYKKLIALLLPMPEVIYIIVMFMLPYKLFVTTSRLKFLLQKKII